MKNSRLTNQPKETPSESDEVLGSQSDSDAAAVSELSAAIENPSSSEQPAPKVTSEEQMARYEEYLKENDWGHQPC